MCIVILRTGDAIPEVAPRRGQFARWIREAIGAAWDGDWLEHDVRLDDPLPAIDGVTAFVITGSSSSVTERSPWMLRTEEYIRRIHERRVPLLGICFGHQLIAQALGGDVQKNPKGREIGTVRVTRVMASAVATCACGVATDGACISCGSVASRGGSTAICTEAKTSNVGFHPLFHGLGSDFFVNATHVDSVVRLPDGARVLAATDLEAHAAFAVGDTTLGVQFHPEIDGDVMREYVKARAHLIAREGLCPTSIHDGVLDAPDGSCILRNFVMGLVRRTVVAA